MGATIPQIYNTTVEEKVLANRPHLKNNFSYSNVVFNSSHKSDWGLNIPLLEIDFKAVLGAITYLLISPRLSFNFAINRNNNKNKKKLSFGWDKSLSDLEI